ncbi:MAG: CotH kinase family protein [Bacteroidaceae bacterium]|nr:CotH kinase family protein [Bacteroidaceae bacterium]
MIAFKLNKFALVATLLCIAFAMDCNAQGNSVFKAPSFKSNLPIVQIRCNGPISKEKRKAKMFIEGVYDGDIVIKLRGNSSMSFNQKKYTIDTDETSFFGMPANKEWSLVCTYTDVSMMRDAFACKLWNEMGHWGPHIQMVEVILNDEYIGVYGFSETITVDKGRLEIAGKKKTADGAKVKVGDIPAGETGYVLRIDKYDESEDYFISKHKGLNNVAGGNVGSMFGGFGNFGAGFSTMPNFPDMQSVVWTCRYPKKLKISDEQTEYVHQFVNDFEDAFLDENNFSLAKLTELVDINSFVDYFIHTELSLNADAYKSSSYFYITPRGDDGSKGKIFAGPVWDYNLAYGSCGFCSAGDINAWAFEGCETTPTPAFWKLFAVNSQLESMVKQRYSELRKTILSNKHILAIIDEYATQLRPTQKRQFEKYPELLKQDGKHTSTPNTPNGFGGFAGGNAMMGGFAGGNAMMGGFAGGNAMMGGFAGGFDDSAMLDMFRSHTVSNYDEEIEYLKKWFADRLSVLDVRFLSN